MVNQNEYCIDLLLVDDNSTLQQEFSLDVLFWFYSNDKTRTLLLVSVSCQVWTLDDDKIYASDKWTVTIFSYQTIFPIHDEVISWEHFLRYWSFVREIHRSPVNSPHEIQWHGALMFSLICAWINGWVNNRESGDFRRQRSYYDVIVMQHICRLMEDAKAVSFT